MFAKQVGAGSRTGRLLQGLADQLSCFGVCGRHSWALRNACREEREGIDLPRRGASVYLRRNGVDHRVFEHIFLQGAYDVHIPAEEVRTVIDCGANIGLSALYFAQRFPQARILAVEPDPDNFAQMLKNVNSCDRIVPVHAAVWGAEEYLRITNPGAASWSFRVDAIVSHEEGDADGLRVPGVTIDGLMREYDIQAIDLLKLDVEGAEHNILQQQADSWLNHVRFIICELHDRHVEGCSKVFHDAMNRNAFSVIYCGENSIAERLN